MQINDSFNLFEQSENLEKLSLVEIASGQFSLFKQGIFKAKVENKYLEGENEKIFIITRQKIIFKNKKCILLLLQDVTAFHK